MDTEMRELLTATAIETDKGEPVTLAHLTATVDMPVERLDQLLKSAQEAALVGRLGRTIDSSGSPIGTSPGPTIGSAQEAEIDMIRPRAGVADHRVRRTGVAVAHDQLVDRRAVLEQL